MNYASVCSGVEAASLAWHSLGWEPVWFSEVEPFPCAVLKHRFPNVPNLGDMTKIEGEKYHGTVDLLVGGTPCQGFSVAGKQGGLDDPRSALCLKYIDLLKTMRPRWFVWENVPGVFSTNGGSDFARFISEIENIGYGVAWRVLDAQYVRTYQFPHAVPQRRRRVFVVGYFGDWRPAAEVLFESNGVFGNPPPRRIKGQSLAGGFETSAGKSVLSDIAGTLDCKCKDGSIRNQNGTGVICSQYGDIAGSLTARHDSSPCADRGQNIVCAGFCQGASPAAGSIGYHEQVSPTIKAGESGTAQVPALLCVHGSQDPICNTEHANAVNRNQGLENVICRASDSTNAEYGHGICPTLAARSYKGGAFIAYENHPADSRIKDCGGICPTLAARYKGGKVISFYPQQKAESMVPLEECSNTLVNGTCPGHQNAVCFENHGNDSRINESPGVSPTITSRAGTGGGNLPLVMRDEEPIGFIKNDAGGEQQGYWTGAIPTIRSQVIPAVAIAENVIGRQVENGGNGIGAQEEVSYTLNTVGVHGVCSSTVRRLTPLECERLMGFPDNWTRIPWGKKPPEGCPDAPRYKACGNSMCVNVMQWIGARIQRVENIIKENEK